ELHARLGLALEQVQEDGDRSRGRAKQEQGGQEGQHLRQREVLGAVCLVLDARADAPSTSIRTSIRTSIEHSALARSTPHNVLPRVERYDSSASSSGSVVLSN